MSTFHTSLLTSQLSAFAASASPFPTTPSILSFAVTVGLLFSFFPPFVAFDTLAFVFATTFLTGFVALPEAGFLAGLVAVAGFFVVDDDFLVGFRTGEVETGWRTRGLVELVEVRVIAIFGAWNLRGIHQMIEDSDEG